MRTLSMATVACATTLLAAACGGTTSAGDPTPAPSAANSSGESRSLKYGTPAVPAPLDFSGIADTPCKAVTKKQANSFAGTLDETQVSKTTLTGKGKSCGWIFKGERYGLGSITGGVVLPSDQHHGLTTIYGSKQHGALTTFRPVGPIAGYPALIYASGRSIGDGFCRLAVGLRNDAAYRITTGFDPDHPGYDTPCESAKKLAQFVVKNLKEGK